MSTISREQARLVWDHAGGLCEYCGCAPRRRDMTIDHWVPQYLGGGDERANLRAACEACNVAKGRLAPEAWAPIAAARREQRAARERPAGARLSRVELLQSITPYWRNKTKDGSTHG